MQLNPDEIKRLIEAGLAGSEASVDGDGRHFEATIVSSAFEGKSLLQQHRLVYDALGDRFDTEVLHALSIKTYTPQQWQQLQP